MATNILVKDRQNLDYFMPRQGGAINIYLGKESKLRFYSFTFGGNSVKNNLNVIFQDKNSRAELYGLYFGEEGQAIENNTFLHHQAPSCKSLQLYYGVLFGNAQATFNGRILVESKAQKTDAYLESKNILLSREAQLLGKPHLEILADNVKCTHAFACSQVEDDEIFYLQSRGIGKEVAKKILLLGFAKKVVNNVGQESLRNKLCAKISQFLSEKLGAKN